MVSPFDRCAFSKKVDELLSDLSKRVYHYPKENSLENIHINHTQLHEKKEEEKNVIKEKKVGCSWLPVKDVILVFQLYRPFSARTHGKSIKRSKMLIRSEGWNWKGSVLLYEEDNAVIWLMSSERKTIDNVFESNKTNKKTKRKRNPQGPFLRRNIKSTTSRYSNPLAGLFFSGTREHPWDPTKEVEEIKNQKSKKRALPQKKRGRPRKKRLVL